MARSCRLPRTRGDGPRHRPASSCPAVASPHTRGWTLWKAQVWEARQGFPAHAGMDPARSDALSTSSGLPRTRGDGPPSIISAKSCHAASPHTRGWTHRRRCGEFRDGGFPAHAGMDPALRSSTSAGRWLPRTRGDGPSPNESYTDAEMASPHTRGWTRFPLGTDQHDLGFPAHAGMDPETEPAPESRYRLPRTRGDGPSIR